MQVPSQTYLQASAVRARYGISDMTIWRWLQNASLGFPGPIRINSRRFWRLTELEAWEASRSGEGKKEAPAEGEETMEDAA